MIFLEKNCFLTFFQCNFSVRTLQCFQKTFKNFFDPEKVKKLASKVAHNQPNLFFTVQPRPQPTAQNWFFVLWNFGSRHLFSYLWILSVRSVFFALRHGILIYHQMGVLATYIFPSKLSKFFSQMHTIYSDTGKDVWCKEAQTCFKGHIV